MNKITLNEKIFECNENKLPLLIHGKDKTGSSLFTVTFATNLFAKGSKLLFLTGYHMAKEEFFKQIDPLSAGDDKVIFCLKDQINEFSHLVDTLPDINERVIIIKNIDLFDEKTFGLISSKQKIIISGDINKCTFKDKILNKKFETKVIFSELENIKTPELQKYQGFLIEDNNSGLVSVKITQ